MTGRSLNYILLILLFSCVSLSAFENNQTDFVKGNEFLRLIERPIDRFSEQPLKLPQNAPHNYNDFLRNDKIIGPMRAIKYVTVEGAGVNDGSSWSNAFNATQLQYAIANANSGDQIWVAAGTYHPTTALNQEDMRTKTFQMKNNLAIYGGFPVNGGSWEERNWEENPTVLSGDINQNGLNKAYHIFYHPAATNLNSTAILDGFIIRDGYADDPDVCAGGGMHNYQSSPTLNNLLFSNNYAHWHGGGLYNYESSPVLENVSFISNTSWYGGGMYNIQNSSPLLNNVLFSENNAPEGGGGGMMNTEGSSPFITNTIFSGNSSEYGGGLRNRVGCNPILTNIVFIENHASNSCGALDNGGASPYLTDVKFIRNSGYYAGAVGNFPDGETFSNPTFVNVEFIENRAENHPEGMNFGGAVLSYGGVVKFINVLFTDNYAEASGSVLTVMQAEIKMTNVTIGNNTSGDDSAFFFTEGNAASEVEIINSIIWNGNDWLLNQDANLTITYSNIQGGFTGTGNINIEPDFTYPSQRDYRLLTGSAGIDAGNNTPYELGGFAYGVEEDLAGANRIENTTVDMGAYEWFADPMEGIFAGGMGTETMPFLVETPGHLNNVRDHLDAHFKQVADIDLDIAPWNTGEGWNPIGVFNDFDPSLNDSFTGIYDGNTYAISNLYIDNTGVAGLGIFAATDSAVLKNLKIINADISGLYLVGALSGYTYMGEIDNCEVSGELNSMGYLGGMVGFNQGTDMSNCKSAANLQEAFLGTVGGLVGRAASVNRISYSYATGSINGSNYIGGLIGEAIAVNVFDCYTNVVVSGNESVGGLIGKAESGSIIADSYAVGSVNGASDIGGLIGKVLGEQGANTQIINTYSIGLVTGTGASIGGLTGFQDQYSSTTNSYWNTNTSMQNSSASGWGRTTAEMTYPYDNSVNQTYTDWDFNSIWDDDVEGTINNGYPFINPRTYIGQLLPPEELATYIDTASNHIHIYWEPVENANLYKVYSASNPYAEFPAGWQYLQSVENTEFAETIPAGRRFYLIIATTETQRAEYTGVSTNRTINGEYPENLQELLNSLTK